MRKSYLLLFSFMFTALIALVGCGGGGGGGSSQITQQETAVPTIKILNTDEDLSAANIQIQQAIAESTKTFTKGYRTNKIASGKYHEIPGLRANRTLTPRALLNPLAPEKSDIFSGLFQKDEYHRTKKRVKYTETSRTLEIARIILDWDLDNIGLQDPKEILKSRLIIKNCDATVTDNHLHYVKALPGAIFTYEEFDDNASPANIPMPEESITLKLLSGAKLETAQEITDIPEPSTTFEPAYGASDIGYITTKTGSEKTKVTVTGPIKLEAVYAENGVTKAESSITLDKVSGNYEIEEKFNIVTNANLINGLPAIIDETDEWQEWFPEDIKRDALEFTDLEQQINLQLSVNYIEEKIKLATRGIFRIKPIKNEQTNKYRFENDTGIIEVDYDGNDYEKYGYIHGLEIVVRYLGYDTDNRKISDGSTFNIVKINSDGSTDLLKYKISNDKLEIVRHSGDNKTYTFNGGSEEVTENNNSETVIKGIVKIATKAGATPEEALNIEYTSTKRTDSSINVRAVIKYGENTKTIFFDRNADMSISNGQVFNGDVTSNTGTSIGTFNVDINGLGTLSMPPKSPINFFVED